MAYGQTGTGKTYTVGNLGKNDASERGILVRAVEDIIANTSSVHDSVEVSYLQVPACSMLKLNDWLIEHILASIFFFLPW